MKRNIVITGGAGFIGSHVVRLFVNKYPEYNIINLDKLTYAGNLANLKDVEDKPNYKFVKMDICDFEAFYQLMQDEKIDGIIHLAAESHVDRSIKDPFTFARTNVMGTLALLQAAKLYWESLPEKFEGKRFYHISTDEVYGALSMNHPEGIEPPFKTVASSEGHKAYGDQLRPLSESLPRHIRTSYHRDQLLEQLWPLPVPGEAHPAVHQQHPQPQTASCVWKGRECARLAFR